MRLTPVAALTALCPALATLVVAPTASAAAASRGVHHVKVPKQGQPVRAKATRYVGHGSPASCTSQAVIRAVVRGGVIKFRCGPAPVTIRMTATAKVVNTSHRVVLDGGGKVTLDGQGKHRILHQNTCDQKQRWTTDHCDDQRYPQLAVQHITLAHGFNGDDLTSDVQGGGGAIYTRGGSLRIVDVTFVGNRCRSTGPDVGGGAVRALDQFHDQPVYVSGSTFRGGRCSNGGALSSIGVSWAVYNSVFRNNHAIGHGANPARSGTPGGGSGGRSTSTATASPCSRRRAHHAQRRERGRWRGLLRQQQPPGHHDRPPLVPDLESQPGLRELSRHLHSGHRQVELDSLSRPLTSVCARPP